MVEALIAMLFMAVVFPVIINAFLTSNRAGTLAERSRLAAELADMKLNELIVTDDWRDGDTGGDFKPDYPGYTWSAYSDGWEADTMRAVHVTVYFQVQGSEYQVELTTLAGETES